MENKEIMNSLKKEMNEIKQKPFDNPIDYKELSIFLSEIIFQTSKFNTIEILEDESGFPFINKDFSYILRIKSETGRNGWFIRINEELAMFLKNNVLKQKIKEEV